MKTKKKTLLCILTLGLLMPWANPVYSQSTTAKISRSKALVILQRANAEYENARYSIAARDYESYLSVDASHPETVLPKLADCYCQIRANDNALRVYKLLFKNGKEGATEVQKVRIGELYARHGMYKEAADWLQDVKGYKAKGGVYNSRLRLESLKRDSLNWEIGFLNINTPYRDYSPVLVDTVLFFSSNKPLSVKKQVSLWDESCYTRLHKIALHKIKTEPITALNPTPSLTKKASKEVVSKSFARQYEGADAKDMESELYFMTDRRYMWDESKDTLGSVVKGLEKIDFNITGIAFDSNSHVYFSANYTQSKNNINRVRLMEGIYSSNKINNIHALPFGDDESYSAMLPAVSRDGNTLVFCSDKAGGRGKMDLYYALRNTKTHEWSVPEAFDWNINTVGNEVFPSITSDGYLYFSSDARPGLGGLDIYRIPLKDALLGDGEPEHLSYPINSSADDFGWTQDNTGMTGFFSSDRLNNDDNLYSFQYQNRQRIDYISGSTVGIQTQNPDQIRYVSGNTSGIQTQESDKVSSVSGSPNDLRTYESKKMRYISGKIVELKTNEPIAGATVFLWNKRTNRVTIAKTGRDGKYHFIVASSDKIILKAVKKGMTNDCLEDNSFSIQQQEDTVMKNMRDLLLEKQIQNDHASAGLSDTSQTTDTVSRVMQNLMLRRRILKINDRWKLNNIHYNFDKWDIRADAKPILDSLITLLKIYPIRVELGSHTDSRGTFEYNDRLSQRRAESVVAYLVEHGIDSNRVTAKGYGKRFLLNRCADGVPCSERDHQVNRRTEVKVTGNTDIQKYQKDNIDLDQFSDGEQIDINELPIDFFDNCDKLNLSKDDAIPFLKKNQAPDLKKSQTPDLSSKYKFPIRFSTGGFNIESQYHYILNELIHVLSTNPSIILQITAQDDANDRSEILSDLRASLIREYLINKGVSASRCQIDKGKKSKSEVPYGNAVLHANNVNLDNLLLQNLILSYKGDSKEMIIRNDNGKYCVQLGVFKARFKSQHLVDKIQSILSVPVFIIQEGSYFKIRTPYSTNRNDAVEIAAIIQASGVLYGK